MEPVITNSAVKLLADRLKEVQRWRVGSNIQLENMKKAIANTGNAIEGHDKEIAELTKALKKLGHKTI